MESFSVISSNESAYLGRIFYHLLTTHHLPMVSISSWLPVLCFLVQNRINPRFPCANDWSHRSWHSTWGEDRGGGRGERTLGLGVMAEQRRRQVSVYWRVVTFTWWDRSVAMETNKCMSHGKRHYGGWGGVDRNWTRLKLLPEVL